MAKLKKTARSKPAARKTVKSSPKTRAEAASHNLIETAQHIWSAGVGALARAQGDGTDLFDALVKKGMSLEARTRKLANGNVDELRGVVEERALVGPTARITDHAGGATSQGDGPVAGVLEPPQHDQADHRERGEG